MPGVSLVFAAPGEAHAPRERWLRALEAARSDAPSARITHFEDSCCRIGSDAHDHYPIEVRESEGTFACLEGRVYGERGRTASDDLLGMATSLEGDDTEAERTISSRMRAWEGEWVAALYRKRSRCAWVFRDPLGRLPLYAARAGGGLAISRDQRFLLEHERIATADRLGLAQLLLFGFPLGRRTYIEGVERVPAGVAFRVDPGGVRALEGLGEPLDFERKDRADHSAERNAGDLADLFTRACGLRAGAPQAPILALSGGLDSRAVAAGLARAGQPFECFTFVDDAGVYARESAVAGEVARALDVPWRELRVPAPRGRTLQRMLEMKSGLNTLAMAFSLDLFEMLHSAFGTGCAYWSGDGGDKVLPDHRPRLSRSGRSDLVSYLIDSRPIWTAGAAARLTGLTPEDIRGSVEEVVRPYPEKSADQGFVRFLFCERGPRWIFEGEDCNRHYYWTVAPFFDRSFLAAALGCPDHHKSGHRLYRHFLRRLEPALTRVRDANLGVPMDSPLYVWSRRMREVGRRFPRLRRWLRQGVPASVLQPRSQLLRTVLTRQLERSAAVGSYFARAALAEVAAAPERHGDNALDCLLTATCAAEQIVERRSTLADFAAERFA